MISTYLKKRKKSVFSPDPSSRILEFIGTHQSDSILLGDYGDAKITAIGDFELSGIVLCRKNTLEIYMEGNGIISLQGRCKTLLIRNISGDCTLDLTNLACKKVQCLSATGKSTILLGRTRVIERLVMCNDAYMRYPGRAVLNSYSLSDNARMEQIVEEAA